MTAIKEGTCINLLKPGEQIDSKTVLGQERKPLNQTASKFLPRAQNASQKPPLASIWDF